MKKTVLLLATAMLLTSIDAVAQNKIDNQGRRQGHWIRTDKDGSLIFEGDFRDGLETGTFTYYYHDGTVRMRNTYIVDGTVCNHEAYDEQGHLLARGRYNRHNRDGHWTFYNEAGRVVKEADYNMGVKDGTHIVFGANNDTAEVTTWHNNRRHGRWWKRIGTNGYITGTYQEGGLQGTLLEYDDNGQLVREGKYSNGLKHGANRYFEDGTLVVDERWNNGILLDRRVLLLTPDTQYISLLDIALLAPQGKHRVLVILKDGTKLTSQQSADELYPRLGNDFLSLANRKSRILVATASIQGLSEEADGRTILLLDPQPDFTIFPDEDGIKMFRSLQYQQDSPLDKLHNNDR